MCISSNSVNQAQDLISVTKFEDFPNSLLPNQQDQEEQDSQGGGDQRAQGGQEEGESHEVSLYWGEL